MDDRSPRVNTESADERSTLERSLWRQAGLTVIGMLDPTVYKRLWVEYRRGVRPAGDPAAREEGSGGSEDK